MGIHPLFCKDFGCLKREKIVGKYRKNASGDERSAVTSMSRKVLRGAWGSYARRDVTIKRANSRGISTHAGERHVLRWDAQNPPSE
jgi:hypothetical protein